MVPFRFRRNCPIAIQVIAFFTDCEGEVIRILHDQTIAIRVTIFGHHPIDTGCCRYVLDPGFQGDFCPGEIEGDVAGGLFGEDLVES